MQINPFGFPLGAGMQSASAIGGTGLGFVDALGLAIDSGAQLVSLKASATPPENLLARVLAVQARLSAQSPSMPATGTLPGLQQPTSLSELMATAAKLPGADSAPVADAAPAPLAQPAPVAADIDPSAPAPEIVVSEIAAPVPAPSAATPEIAKPAAPLAAVPTAPAKGDAEPQPEGDVLPAAPTSKITETAPAKPQKGARGRAVTPGTDPAPTAETKPAMPAEMLALNPIPQPVAQQQQQQQQQPVPREASAKAEGGPTILKASKVGTPGAPAPDAAQSAATGTTDFVRAVAAKTESSGSEPNPDGPPQPEPTLKAAAKTDAAAPPMPQHAHGTPSIDGARAAAPATPGEPVIEAQAGHLGHSLGVEIARKVQLGEETLRIRLNPIELGRIEVTLAFDDRGSLQATVRTESAQAMDLLRQDTPDLARTLDQAGVRTDAQSFRFESRAGNGGGQQAEQQHQQNRSGFAASDDDALLAAEPAYRPVRSDGRVDLLA